MIVVTISGKPINRNPPKPKTRVIFDASDSQTVGQPDNQIVGQSDNQTIRQSDNQIVGQSDNQTIRQSDNQIVGHSDSLNVRASESPSVHDSLWQEIISIKSERETLSSSIAPLVARFQREGKIVGTQILDPEAKTQLSKLYDEIDKLTKEASEVYRQIDSGEKSTSEGSSPLRGDAEGRGGIAELKLLKRSLQNRRHKLRKKIESAQALQKVKTAGGMSPLQGGGQRPGGVSATKLQQWLLQLAQIDTEEQSVNEKLENL